MHGRNEEVPILAMRAVDYWAQSQGDPEANEPAHPLPQETGW